MKKTVSQKLEDVRKTINDGCETAELKKLQKKLYRIHADDCTVEEWLEKHTLLNCISEMLAQERGW